MSLSPIPDPRRASLTFRTSTLMNVAAVRSVYEAAVGAFDLVGTLKMVRPRYASMALAPLPIVIHEADRSRWPITSLPLPVVPLSVHPLDIAFVVC